MKFFKKIKIVKYITLLQKYNKLENDYNVLKEAIEEKCFDVIFAQVNIPEQVQKKDRTIKRLKKQNEALKKELKLIEENN